ncbi:MAG: type VI secretion system ATPase TssH, partial [Tidjanibacter sp.]|nr:type VI secretion system ATPase TssH [Tidjanibacter sp.]
ENFSRSADDGTISAEVVEQTRDQVMDLMKQALKPEFLNRVDEIIMFTPLTKDDIRSIVKMQLSSLRGMLQHNGVELEVTPAAVEWLADNGYDPMFGARPVKRTIQRYVVNDLSKQILAGNVNREKPIVIDSSDGELKYKN